MSGVETSSGPLQFAPVMLAIAGASGSGKSTLAAELARTLGGRHFSLDNYYRDLGHRPHAERTRKNFDDPAMMDARLLQQHIAALAEGRSVARPVYDFAAYTSVPGEFDLFEPGPLVVVEGLFSIYFPELRPYYHLSVYVDTPDALCFERRLKRDVEERGRLPESVKRQYEATVRPCGLAFVRPLIDFADLSIDGADALDFKIEQVVSAMRKRGLLAQIGDGAVPK